LRTILAMVFGILMGVYSALKRDTVLAKIFQAVSLIGISLADLPDRHPPDLSVAVDAGLAARHLAAGTVVRMAVDHGAC